MARPTKFNGLYIQYVGRGLRLHPSKSDCLVLDFADEGHNLETVASLGKTIPIEYCSGSSEDFARINFKLDFAAADAPWFTSQEPLTSGQIVFLEKNGVSTNGMTKSKASMRIREIIAKKRK